jgi:hypothetical protein
MDTMTVLGPRDGLQSLEKEKVEIHMSQQVATLEYIFLKAMGS